MLFALFSDSNIFSSPVKKKAKDASAGEPPGFSEIKGEIIFNLREQNQKIGDLLTMSKKKTFHLQNRALFYFIVSRTFLTLICSQWT